VLPQTGWDILSENEMDDMIGLLDPCLSSSGTKDGFQLAGAALVRASPSALSNRCANPYAHPANYGVPQKRTGQAITQKQLQALTKKHLLLMLRDSEKELAQAKELLAVYQAMFEYRQGTEGRRLYE